MANVCQDLIKSGEITTGMKDHAQFLILLALVVGFVIFANFVYKKQAPKIQSRQPSINSSQNIQQEKDSQNKNDSVTEKTSDSSSDSVKNTVAISGFRRSYGDQPARITLRSKLEKGGAVVITDWQIKGNNGRVFIPEAVKFYRINGTNDQGAIVLQPGDYVNVYIGGMSPIGKNFRLNKCTGYLNEDYDFQYSIPNECPRPEKDNYKHLSGECQNYIQSLSRCELPDPDSVNSFRGEGGNLCREFINDYFTINNCYKTYKDDPDFLGHEWRVWINRSRVFDSQHDWLRLINNNGEIVDEYTY